MHGFKNLIGFTVIIASVLGAAIGTTLWGLARVDHKSCERQVAPRAAQRDFFLTDAAFQQALAGSSRRVRVSLGTPAGALFPPGRSMSEYRLIAAERWRLDARTVPVPNC